MNKRGMSHVEVMISFAIFIGFTFFLLSVFRPFEIRSEGNVYLGVLEREIIDRTQKNIGYQPLRLKEENNCFEVDKEFDESITVKNENKSIVEGKRSGSKLIIGNYTDDFFYILSSSVFVEKEHTCSDRIEEIDESNYTFGLWRQYSMVSNESLYDLKEEYEDNYSSLKEDLGLPGSEDFSLAVKNKTEGVIFDTYRENPEEEIYSKSRPIQIVYKSGEIEYGVLNIRTW